MNDLAEHFLIGQGIGTLLGVVCIMIYLKFFV